MTRPKLYGVYTWMILIAAVLPLVYAKVDPIVVKGSHFYYKSNGTAFFIRGVTYRTDSFSAPDLDMLSDESTCEKDLAYLLDLRINVVRVLGVDPTLDHSGCMNAFAEAGIYVIADLSTAWIQGITPLWHEGAWNGFKAVVDSLASFTNLMALSVGDVEPSQESIYFAKSAVRDMKAYIRDKQYRDIPIGWTTWKDASIAVQEAVAASTCDGNPVDFVGITLDTPEFINCPTEDQAEEFGRSFSNTTIPIFAATSGCGVQTETGDARNFTYMNKLYPTSADGSLSGGIVVTLKGRIENNKTIGLVVPDANGSMKPMAGYTALSSVMATITPTFPDATAYTPTATTPSCPQNANWTSSTALPPKPYPPLCSCMVESLRCVVTANTLDTLKAKEMGTWEDNVESICNEDGIMCGGIMQYTQNGTYGAFSACNHSATYSWAANQYLIRNGHESCAPSNSTSSVLADLRTERPPPTDDCKFLLDQAGQYGLGTVTATLGASPKETGASSTEPSRSETGTGKLSRGAKAGIALGVLSFVGLALLAALFLLRRMKQAKKEAASLGDEDDREYNPPDTCEKYDQGFIAELPGESTFTLHELPEGTAFKLSELPAHSVFEIRELPSETGPHARRPPVRV